MISFGAFSDEIQKIAEADGYSSASPPSSFEEDHARKRRELRMGVGALAATAAGIGAVKGGKHLVGKADKLIGDAVKKHTNEAGRRFGESLVQGAQSEAKAAIKRPVQKAWKILNTDVRDLVRKKRTD